MITVLRTVGWMGLLCATTLALGLNAVAGAESPSALESDPDGWIDILPGPDLAGWKRIPASPNKPLGRQQWHVDREKRLLICDGDGGHDLLLYTRPFTNLIFHVEYRFVPVPGAKRYDSGVYVRTTPDGRFWHQAQLGSGVGGYLFGTTSRGGEKSFFNRLPRLKDQRMKPAGEWNTLEVTARDQTLTLWVNGAVTSEYTRCGVPFGCVGVEGEGSAVEFRNLKVKVLP